MTLPGGGHHDETRRDAARTLDRLRHEGDELGGALSALARRGAAHFWIRSAEDDDGIEVWGRRIGRALSLAACIGLAVYLFVTYLS